MMEGNKHRRRRNKCPIPKSTFTTYMDEGNMHYRAGRYKKALFCYDRALDLQPGNQSSLVARSQCHLKLGNGEAALRDAQDSFDEDYSYAKGLLQYAEALYNMSLFEKALIAYHRGNRLRNDMDDFRLGIQKCEDVIIRTTGNPIATQIEDLDEILPIMQELEDLENRKYPHCCIRPGTDELEGKDRIKLPKKTKGRSSWVAREVLGRMYTDKDFFVKFLKRPDIKGENSVSAKLRNSANEALNYLEIRENFWRSQNPMYARRQGLNFNKNMVLIYEDEEVKKRETNRKIRMDAAEGAVLLNIERINHSLEIGRVIDAQLECDRTLRQMRDMSTNLLPKKPEFMCQVLHSKGIAYEKMKKFDKAIEAFQEELLIATESRLLDHKAKALNYLGRSYAFKLAFTEASDMWEARLQSASAPEERSYLLHEIGRCYTELEKYDIAFHYAHQSFEEARRAGDGVWEMNAKILSGQIDLKTSNFESAEANFQSAQIYAIKCGNNVNAKLLADAVRCLQILIEKRNKGELPSESTNGIKISISENPSSRSFIAS